MASSSRQVQLPLVAVGASALALSAAIGCHIWRARSAARAGSACRLRLRLLFGSQTGTCEKWARRVEAELQSGLAAAGVSAAAVEVIDLTTFPFDNLLEKDAQPCVDVVLVLLSTQAEGLPPASCSHFLELLEDHVNDHRVGKTAMSHLDFAVLGFGSSDYETAGHYCTAALRTDAGFTALSARRLLPAARVSDTGDAEPQIAPWLEQLSAVLVQLAQGHAVSYHTEKNAVMDLAQEMEDSGSDSDGDSTSARSEGQGKDEKTGSDLEELATSCGGSVAPKVAKVLPDMVTKRQREQLTKEGYKIIGTHSAVKLCRWTKHQLRGRGGCYKHSFYGITSYQCMESTPSMACANKCVFCWRHHKNPTGTSWKWKMDDPVDIVTQSVAMHQQMIREAKGIPGVKPDRLKEAMTPRHCALSLVGEPIMYPRINELLDELHRRRISTFMVTNAQHPDAMDNLRPVTQLYVSIDAGTKEALQAIDRPIFADFWDRFTTCLRQLALKQQRTVYRLTLVKDKNMTDPKDYAKLVALGQPDLLEIKSVTFCGESKASDLTMGNVPWHEEVKNFAESMLSFEGLSDEYELACEHQHSCIVLIAHKRFKIEGQWHTWIDYERYHELLDSGKPFSALDYSMATPDWALYGSEEQGFDPKEQRVFHNRTKRRAKEGLLSEEQLKRYPVNPATVD